MADVAVGLPILSRRSRSAKITAVAPKSGNSTKSAKSTNIPRVQKSKVPKHPTYSVMVYTAIKDLQDRNGASNFMINRYIASRYFCDGKAARTRTVAALKKGLADGSLILVTGVGARGMFKVANESSKSHRVPRVAASKTAPKKASKSTSKSSKSSKRASKSARKSTKSTKSATQSTSSKSVKKSTKAKSKKTPTKRTVKPKKA
ncbi:hypothetical protein L5515_003671 [Caenorhabditis briggsae]|uniref:H15 domain-containing protein n=1 Tax=Caenorhabditis briggsae TaxID=6238 RepID=A0AAE9ELC0_CAEBR|nr:hypothetical protein L5515_003667 [Caenorhabditis briggsae]UMM22474.1 hypothetical protein L5515_003669 [Caenorhabditis briggsae]UMM22477.1 hypothetical protein L5515_003671 [Caenorhabditis briggsae]